jgi:hypothetical protein
MKAACPNGRLPKMPILIERALPVQSCPCRSALRL